MRAKLAVAVAAMVLCATAVHAQDDTEKAKPPKPKPNCADGVKYDDGKLEWGLRQITLFRADAAMLIEAPSYPAKLNRVCIYWWRAGLGDRQVFFDLRIWDADGPEGSPGTLLHELPSLSASKVTPRGAFYTYDVSWAEIVIDGPVYIGPSWYPSTAFLLYLGFDSGPRTPRRRGFYGDEFLREGNPPPPNVEAGVAINALPQYKAFGIRAVFAPVP